LRPYKLFTPVTNCGWIVAFSYPELRQLHKHSYMDNERYLYRLQEEYLKNSKAYMDAIREGKTVLDLKQQATELRSLLTEIKAVKEEIERSKNK